MKWIEEEWVEKEFDEALMDWKRVRYPALLVPWGEVHKVLGHAHRKTIEDDRALIQALLHAGAPGWVKQARTGWEDAEGWGLIGLERAPHPLMIEED